MKKKKKRRKNVAVSIIQSSASSKYFGTSVLDELEFSDIVLDQVTFDDGEKLVFVTGRNKEVTNNILELLKSYKLVDPEIPVIKVNKKARFYTETEAIELIPVLKKVGMEVKYPEELLSQVV